MEIQGCAPRPDAAGVPEPGTEQEEERELPLLKTYMGHGYEVLDARGSCDNSQLVSCSMDKTVVLWDVSSGNWSRKWRGHMGYVNCVAFNEDSSVVVSCSMDK